MPPGAYAPVSSPPAPSQFLATQSDTAGLENNDRVARFARLAAQMGTMPPQVEQLWLPPGSVSTIAGPVPVVRATFDEKVFFDFDQATPRPEANWVLDLMAENMKRDVPDAALTVLGHTDAIGAPDYNVDLSRRRASAVLSALVERGVNPAQLSTVAIGEAQPVAPNDTPDGRARNRRVEFMVSASEAANLSAVQQHAVPARFFVVNRAGPVHRVPVTNVVEVLRPDPRRSADQGIFLQPAMELHLKAPEPAAGIPVATAPVQPAKPDNTPPVQVRKAEPVEP